MNRLFLVRHGENVANLTKEFSYRLVDRSLTDKGVEQARQTAVYFQDKSIHAVYTSPLKRAAETAARMGGRLPPACGGDRAFSRVECRGVGAAAAQRAELGDLPGCDAGVDGWGSGPIFS